MAQTTTETVYRTLTPVEVKIRYFFGAGAFIAALGAIGLMDYFADHGQLQVAALSALIAFFMGSVSYFTLADAVRGKVYDGEVIITRYNEES